MGYYSALIGAEKARDASGKTMKLLCGAVVG